MGRQKPTIVFAEAPKTKIISAILFTPTDTANESVTNVNVQK